MKRSLIALIVFCAVAAVADTAADAVMLRKKPEAQPAHSFLEDVAPVKEIKAEEKKPEVEPEVKVPDHVPDELVVLDEPLTLKLFDAPSK